MSEMYVGLNRLPVYVRTFYDHKREIMHVLDLNNPESPSVTNSIERLREQIMARHRIWRGLDTVGWFLYGTDGIISEFKGGQFFFVDPDDERVHQEFKQAMAR